MKLIALLLFSLSIAVFANPIEKRIHRDNWNGIDVVWFEDNRFPTYDIAIYFADGSLSETKGSHGTTEMFFSLIDSGTRRFTQKEISDNLEFFGVSLGVNVTHEYSSLEFSGLTKDLIPTAKKICHLFDDATFPEEEIAKYKKSKIDGLRSLEGNPNGLVERVFRELSLSGSPYSYPVSGKIADISRINRKLIQERHQYFNKQVKKKIYLTGPAEILKIKDVLVSECGWDLEKSTFVRSNSYSPKQQSTTKVVLVPVANSNQAQVRIGRFLNKTELAKPEAMKLAYTFLGGGFTSTLMRELRVKRGLTYSVSAYAGGQKDYGRATLSTFTKNETLKQLLEVTRDTLSSVGKKEFTSDEIVSAKGLLSGREPFTYEKSSAFLSYILYFDHIERDLSEMFAFNSIIQKISEQDVASTVGSTYDWNKQTIVVLGDKSLAKELSAFGKVEIVNYKDFL